MVNSRDISLLRPDVCANLLIFIRLMALVGYDVLVTGTVRDNEYQQWCFDNGYSNAQTPSFHSVKARLAFDICKNIKGEEYNDEGFWLNAGAIGKLIGFTWGGDWKSITDKPHFQWDDHGKYTGAMVRAGTLPPTMPLHSTNKDIIQSHCNFSDPKGVWQYLDKHPYADKLYEKWAKSYEVKS